MPYFVYYSIIIKAVVLQTPNNWAVKIKNAPAKWASMICSFWKSEKSLHRPFVLNTSEHNLYYTDIQTREHRQRKDK